MRREGGREITIRGTIVPAEWDEDGNATSIAIVTAEEEEYIVFLNKTGEELLPFTDHRIEVTGTVKNV